MTAVHAGAFMNANRDQKEHPKPIEVLMPWSTAEKKADVSPEERAALTAQLHQYSAFAD